MQKLTPRENEIYNLLLQGLTYLEIARQLIIEECTVITHVSHIYEKMECHSRIGLMKRRIDELEKEVNEMQEQVSYWRSFVRK